LTAMRGWAIVARRRMGVKHPVDEKIGKATRTAYRLGTIKVLRQESPHGRSEWPSGGTARSGAPAPRRLRMSPLTKSGLPLPPEIDDARLGLHVPCASNIFARSLSVTPYPRLPTYNFLPIRYLHEKRPSARQGRVRPDHKTNTETQSTKRSAGLIAGEASALIPTSPCSLTAQAGQSNPTAAHQACLLGRTRLGQLWWAGWGDVGQGIAPPANGVEVSNCVSDGARRC